MTIAEYRKKAEEDLSRMQADRQRILATLRGVDSVIERQIGRLEVLRELEQEAALAGPGLELEGDPPAAA